MLTRSIGMGADGFGASRMGCLRKGLNDTFSVDAGGKGFTNRPFCKTGNTLPDSDICSSGGSIYLVTLFRAQETMKITHPNRNIFFANLNISISYKFEA
jgi:hypothetical protein